MDHIPAPSLLPVRTLHVCSFLRYLASERFSVDQLCTDENAQQRSLFLDMSRFRSGSLRPKVT